MTEIYTRRVKGIAGNGTTTPKITGLGDGKRLHGVGINITVAVTTLAGLMTNITELRVFVGSKIKRRISGTKLRDYMLLNGTTYDFDQISTTNYQLYIPFAEDWFIANVADALAWNAALLGAPVKIEIDCGVAITLDCFERVSDDLDAPSAGIITWDTIAPVAGGTAFYVEKEVNLVGKLIQASIYPDSGATNAITPASLFVGRDGVAAYEAVTSIENADIVARAGLTPTASGRTANVFDMVFVRGDALAHAIDLEAWGKAQFKIQAAAAMSGTCTIVLARLERSN